MLTTVDAVAAPDRNAAVAAAISEPARVPVVRTREGAAPVAPNHVNPSGDLKKEVAHWIRMEEANPELKNRVASALDELKNFIDGQQSDLERRRGKLLQKGSFRETTQAMEAALANIQQLFCSKRNVSRIFADADRYITAFKVDDTLSRLHTRTQLAEARDEFMCAFHDSIPGTKLSGLLDILYFMPYSYWRSRGLERRNYRAPSAAEILNLLEELGRRNVECNRIDTVQLAAILRIQLGITPRMDYHNMPANKLAEQLTNGETLARFTAKAMPIDEVFCRTAAGILADIRRWSDEVLGGTGLSTPAEIETEMLQIVFLAADAISINGTEVERSVDFLWLLATVIASARATLKDVLSWPAVRNTRHPSVYGRILDTKTYLDKAAVLADAILMARWSETRVALNSLVDRSEALAAKSGHEYSEVKELEQLKEKRSEVVKSMIKSSESLQLIEPALLDMLAAPADPSELPKIKTHLKTLDPAALMDRNRAILEETKLIARQELDRLRLLIERIAAIGRNRFEAAATQEARGRSRRAGTAARKTTDGVEIGSLPAADVQEKLLAALRKALATVRDGKGKIEGARKRPVKSELLPALLALQEKIRRAGDICDKIDAATLDCAQAPAAAETVAPLLREILTAETGLGMRLNNAKLTPAEKQPLATLVAMMKAKVSDDLRDLDLLSAEIAVRSMETAEEPCAGADSAPELLETVRVGDVAPETALAPAASAPDGASSDSAAHKMAALSRAANAALKPVKEKMSRLNAVIADRELEGHPVLAAARDLRNGIAEARELMTAKLALIETVAATFDMTYEEYVEKFNRWHGQLATVDTEAERLLGMAESIAGVEAGVKSTTAFAQGITVPFQLLSAECSGNRELTPVRERCALAHESIVNCFMQLRETREACAAAAGTAWPVFKEARSYLVNSGSALAACEDALLRSQSWLDELRSILDS